MNLGQIFSPQSERRRFPLQLHIATLLISLIVVTGALIAWVNYYKVSQIVETHQREQFAQVTDNLNAQVDALFNNTHTLIATLRLVAPSVAKVTQDEPRWLPLLAHSLAQESALTAAYIGDQRGDFYLVRALRNEAMRAQFSAPTDTAYMVSTVTAGKGNIRFFDRHLQPLQDGINRSYPFDPRTRPWYRSAQEKQALIVTEPYPFFSGQDVGVTFAQPSPDGTKVAGVDIALSQLGHHLNSDVFSASTQMLLLDDQYRILATNGQHDYATEHSGRNLLSLSEFGEDNHPAIAAMVSQTQAGEYYFEAQAKQWIGRVSDLPVVQSEFHLMVISPVSELFAAAERGRLLAIVVSLLVMLASVPIAFYLSRVISRPLKSLKKQTETITAFHFEQAASVDSRVLEVYQLSNATQCLQNHIAQFAEVSTIVGQETNFEQLKIRYLKELLQFIGMNHAGMYLSEGDELILSAEIEANEFMPLIIDDSAQSPLLDEITKATKDKHVYSGWMKHLHQEVTYLISPMVTRDERVMGVLVFYSMEAKVVSPHLPPFFEALSSVMTVAIENRQLAEQQKSLMYAFIRLIAQAIDAKSPYTGAHCERVPELTRMIAKAAQAKNKGPFADFSLTDEQWEELFVASWLHDCGKITTPEHIVDKATKLETIHDRIHEIRTRFEVIKRDEIIQYWRAKAEGKTPNKTELTQKLQQINDDYVFVAHCNQGGEFLSDKDAARLDKIATRTWQRTLSDRVGLGHMALARYQGEEPTLPVTEQLLSDKPEHCIKRLDSAAAARHGFSLQMPELEQNMGELYNLKISRGTLNEEERYKINDHIIQTILLLESLPFPDHLSQVPEIAGGHHEKVDGTGYPRGLTKAQMPATARMMAVADIFEALTASDRPYKKGKSLSEALNIMAKMVEQQHIDADIFQLFVESGVYSEYARKFINPSQVDVVRESDLLRQPVALF
uniref:HD domain-containing phosphohydrolase n=1 Tax=Thaumasiovibrio occultus TaxID=1891184 RepID=UPI000B35EF68|nr:HD domain-containing phosphohydrolase [Thaumasiovibrio occultus]